eukprot:scpid49420/ scgid28945/ 
MQIGTTVIVPVYHMPTSAMPMSAVPKYNYNVTPTAPPTSSTQSLRLLVTNAFSLANKFGEFVHTVTHHNVDIAVVTETRFDATIMPAKEMRKDHQQSIRS